MFTKALSGDWLSPSERAGMKLIKGLIVSAAMAGFIAVYPSISTGSLAAIDWRQVVNVFFTTAVFSIINAVWKYVTAYIDNPLTPQSANGAAIMPPPTDTPAT